MATTTPAPATDPTNPLAGLVAQAIASGSGGNSGTTTGHAVDTSGLRKPIGVNAPKYDPNTYDSSGKIVQHGGLADYGYLAPGEYGDPRYRSNGTDTGNFNAGQMQTGDRYGIAPGFFEGDEYGLMAGKSFEDVSRMQQALVQAKLMKGNWQNGVWDDNSADSFKDVLQYANRRGFTVQAAIDELANNQGLRDKNGNPVKSGLPSRAPFVAQLTNPDDLHKVFKQALYNTTGGNFGTDEDAQKYVQAYQDAEMKAQRANYDKATSGGEITKPPAADVAAEDQIKATDAGGVAADSFAGYGKVLESLVKQGGV